MWKYLLSAAVAGTTALVANLSLTSADKVNPAESQDETVVSNTSGLSSGSKNYPKKSELGCGGLKKGVQAVHRLNRGSAGRDTQLEQRRNGEDISTEKGFAFALNFLCVNKDSAMEKGEEGMSVSGLDYLEDSVVQDQLQKDTGEEEIKSDREQDKDLGKKLHPDQSSETAEKQEFLEVKRGGHDEAGTSMRRPDKDSPMVNDDHNDDHVIPEGVESGKNKIFSSDLPVNAENGSFLFASALNFICTSKDSAMEKGEEGMSVHGLDYFEDSVIQDQLKNTCEEEIESDREQDQDLDKKLHPDQPSETAEKQEFMEVKRRGHDESGTSMCWTNKDSPMVNKDHRHDHVIPEGVESSKNKSLSSDLRDSSMVNEEINDCYGAGSSSRSAPEEDFNRRLHSDQLSGVEMKSLKDWSNERERAHPDWQVLNSLSTQAVEVGNKLSQMFIPYMVALSAYTRARYKKILGSYNMDSVVIEGCLTSLGIAENIEKEGRIKRFHERALTMLQLGLPIGQRKILELFIQVIVNLEKLWGDTNIPHVPINMNGDNLLVRRIQLLASCALTLLDIESDLEFRTFVDPHPIAPAVGLETAINDLRNDISHTGSNTEGSSEESQSWWNLLYTILCPCRGSD